MERHIYILIHTYDNRLHTYAAPSACAAICYVNMLVEVTRLPSHTQTN